MFLLSRGRILLRAWNLEKENINKFHADNKHFVMR